MTKKLYCDTMTAKKDKKYLTLSTETRIIALTFNETVFNKRSSNNSHL